MQLFANNETVSLLEQEINSNAGVISIAKLTELAWHLRQRDTQRALELCDTIKHQISVNPLDQVEHIQITARILLVDAESAWLKTDFDEARHYANGALNHFLSISDNCGQADAYWLLAHISLDEGDKKALQQQLALCKKHAQAAADVIRFEIVSACIARHKVLEMHYQDEEIWVRHFQSLTNHHDEGLLTWVFDFLGIYANQYSDFETGATQLIRSRNAALNSGQMSRAIVATTNICYSMVSLHDAEAGIKWGQRALQLAQPKQWPIFLGLSLAQTAEAFLKVDQFDAAKELLNEALLVLKKVSKSPSYLNTLLFLADTALAQFEYSKAYDYFQKINNHPIAQFKQDIEWNALRGQAQALLNLDQIDAALHDALAALQIARSNNYPDHEITSLCVLSDIFSKKSALSGNNPDDNKSSLNYLLEALTIGKQIQNYTISDELYSRIASQYAKQENFSAAYSYSLLAAVAREKRFNADTNNRIMGLQLRLKTDKAFIESKHNKAMLDEQARRADELEKANETLSLISTVGQEITTELRLENIYPVIARQISALLETTHFSISLLDPTGMVLHPAYGIEDGKDFMQRTVPIDNPMYFSARCVRERREIVFEQSEGIDPAVVVPNSKPMESIMFYPLIVAERVIGVMTVQSQKKHAYQERERLIFRALCSYTAIAIDNANAYRRLTETQNQLVEQEKMAALGSLVAGVAHEINTPVGVIVTSASVLSEASVDIKKNIDEGTIKRSDMNTYLSTALESTRLIVSNAQRAAHLIQSFKQVAVDQTSEHRREFELCDFMNDVIASLNPSLRRNHIKININCTERITMDGYPGLLAQVVTNLTMNAVTHAFSEETEGQIDIDVSATASTAMIHFRDNGKGIPEDIIGKIFQPFFTTKRGQGGTGLGLNIVFNIISKQLGGNITAHNHPDQGALFKITVPRVTQQLKT